MGRPFWTAAAILLIKLAGLDSTDANKTAYVSAVKTNPSYSLPPHLMSGIQCRQINVKRYDDAALERAVEEACKEMRVRSGGKGFPVLLDESSSKLSIAVAAVQRVVGAALLYTHRGREKNKATEAEVEEWVRRWKRGEETRALVMDEYITRGWEAKELVAIGSTDTENLVMRTCGFCILILIRD